ncbi:hypothetical protein Tco_0722938 [Tanacetum coccineum]
MRKNVSLLCYARGITIQRGEWYSTKRILAVTHVSVMRKRGYGYLEEIAVRRANNVLYRFKEGDFSRLRINDIEDMLILVKVWLFKRRSRSLQLELKLSKTDSTSPSMTYKTDIRKRPPEKSGESRIMRTEMEVITGTKPTRVNTTAGNPVKKILLKLNLSDHRSILIDSKEYLKMVMERQSVKVKEIQERCIIKAFQDYQIKKGMSMSVQKLQDHEMAKFTRWRNEIMLG